MSQIPPDFLDAVVPLSHQEQPETRWESHGTGFLFAAQRNLDNVPFERLFLVTAKHNFLDQQGNNVPWIYLGFNRDVAPGAPDFADNPEEARSAVFELELVNTETHQPNWTAHDRADVAVIQIDGNQLVENRLRYNYFHGDNHAWRITELDQLHCSEGDSVFIVGFPANLDERIGFYPVVRQGCIGRIRDTLNYGWPSYLVSGIVSAGNSGSPIIFHPSPWHVADTQGPAEARLVGIVSDFVHNLEPVVGQNNILDRAFRFPQNAGLITAWTVDLIEVLINDHLERFPNLLPLPPGN